jgi:hypothetical protein
VFGVGPLLPVAQSRRAQVDAIGPARGCLARGNNPTTYGEAGTGFRFVEDRRRRTGRPSSGSASMTSHGRPPRPARSRVPRRHCVGTNHRHRAPSTRTPGSRWTPRTRPTFETTISLIVSPLHETIEMRPLTRLRSRPGDGQGPWRSCSPSDDSPSSTRCVVVVAAPLPALYAELGRRFEP